MQNLPVHPALLLFGPVALVLCTAPAAQVGTVVAEQKISATAGGIVGPLEAGDSFGWAAASLGDFDGDGVGDVAVGAIGDDDAVPSGGAVWILFLNPDGTVKDEQKISGTEGGFGGTLGADDDFGSSIAAIGDVDGDGVADLAVGADRSDGGGTDRGAVWILFLNANATVKAEQKISDTEGWPGAALNDADFFGGSVSGLGDLDGDGVRDIAVGAPDDDRSISDPNQGAVWILFLNQDGTVKAHQKINETNGGFGPGLDPHDRLGCSVASLGDLDGDGVVDLAVGARGDDDGLTSAGAVWILFLQSDGTVKARQKISRAAGGFDGVLLTQDQFGSAVSSWDDLDGDGIQDLAVGLPLADDAGVNVGAVWILLLNSDGTVKAEQKISATQGNFGGSLDEHDQFGISLACTGDLDGDGTPDLFVGANADDDGDLGTGAGWVLFLEGDTTAPSLHCPPSVAVLVDKGGAHMGTFAFFTVTADDVSDPDPTVVCIPPSGSLFPYGVTIVTCTATDDAGNQSSCTFPVFVLPTVRPRG